MVLYRSYGGVAAHGTEQLSAQCTIVSVFLRTPTDIPTVGTFISPVYSLLVFNYHVLENQFLRTGLPTPDATSSEVYRAIDIGKQL
jgi:hypothetical protein